MSETENLYAYVVIFEGVSVPQFTAAINKLNRSVQNWYTVLPQTVFIVSSLSAADLTDRLRERVPNIGRMLVLDADTDRNGWLPRAAWDFLRSPRASEK